MTKLHCNSRDLKVVATGGNAKGARLLRSQIQNKIKRYCKAATCLKSTLLIFLLWPVISPTLVPLHGIRCKFGVEKDKVFWVGKDKYFVGSGMKRDLKLKMERV